MIVDDGTPDPDYHLLNPRRRRTPWTRSETTGIMSFEDFVAKELESSSVEE